MKQREKVEAQWSADFEAGLKEAGVPGLVPRTARRFFWYVDMIAERKACFGIGPGAVVVPGLETLRSVFAGLARLMPNDAQGLHG
ncbi:MAG: hypothetical protein ABJA98_13305 [Acidobacteriota bacterium]